MRPNPQFPADLLTFTEEILNTKLYFLCGERLMNVDLNITFSNDMSEPTDK